MIPHGHAAPKPFIDDYIARNFNAKQIQHEIQDPNNQIYVLVYEQKIVGFSKVMLDFANENIAEKNVTKMERIYLLQEYYGLGLGQRLFEFNVALAKKQGQVGMWLHVWIENRRAIQFYRKMGMLSVGSYDFPVSQDHTNPNHVMYLSW